MVFCVSRARIPARAAPDVPPPITSTSICFGNPAMHPSSFVWFLVGAHPSMTMLPVGGPIDTCIGRQSWILRIATSPCVPVRIALYHFRFLPRAEGRCVESLRT